MLVVKLREKEREAGSTHRNQFCAPAVAGIGLGAGQHREGRFWVSGWGADSQTETQTCGAQSHSRSEKREVRKGAVEAAWPMQPRKLNLEWTAGPKA